jgi:hypothetical protein
MKHYLIFGLISLVVLGSCTNSRSSQNPIVGNSLVASVDSKRGMVSECEFIMKEELLSLSNERANEKTRLSQLILQVENVKKDFEDVYNEIYQSKKLLLDGLSEENRKSVVINDKKPYLTVDFNELPLDLNGNSSTDNIYKKYNQLINKLTHQKAINNLELSSILAEKKNLEQINFKTNNIVDNLVLLYSIEYTIAELESSIVGSIKVGHSYGPKINFNKILALAYPSNNVIKVGDEFEVMVMMAAFSSDVEPVIEPSVGNIKNIKDGVATIKVKALKEGPLRINGSIGITEKTGAVKFKSYETSVTVIKK